MEADGNNRAFDTSSDKIWDRVNRGVCNICLLRTTWANTVYSDNGKTSSTDTWRPLRTTSRKSD